MKLVQNNPEGRAGPSGATDLAAYALRLYIAGQTPKCRAATINIKTICETYLAGNYKLEVIDLVDNPTLAASDQIVAIPTLVRTQPLPVRRIIGDLGNTERVLAQLDLVPRPA
jgi:circadian clock protein KaiB